MSVIKVSIVSSNEEIFSYVKLNNSLEVIEIKEKNKISNNACTGAYGFSSINDLKKYDQNEVRNYINELEFTILRELINVAELCFDPSEDKTLLTSDVEFINNYKLFLIFLLLILI